MGEVYGQLVRNTQGIPVRILQKTQNMGEVEVYGQLIRNTQGIPLRLLQKTQIDVKYTES